jgi:hypothetical protein
MFINEPYKFDSNLILACSNNMSNKRGYKTAGTTIHEKSRKLGFVWTSLTSERSRKWQMEVSRHDW